MTDKVSVQVMEDVVDEFESTFDLSDLIRLHKGICYAAFEDAIDSYELDVELAADTFLPAFLREELVEEYYSQLEIERPIIEPKQEA